jgi:hypothetical protein
VLILGNLIKDNITNSNDNITTKIDLPRTKIPATISCRKDAEKSPYPVGKHRKFLGNGSSIPAGSFSDFFR